MKGGLELAEDPEFALCCDAAGIIHHLSSSRLLFYILITTFAGEPYISVTDNDSYTFFQFGKVPKSSLED